MKTKADGEFTDLILIREPTEDGKGVRGLRLCGGRIEIAEVRPSKEGQDISSCELVQLHPTGLPLLYDVEVIFSPEEKTKGEEKEEKGRCYHGGPPRVVSNAYRHGWEVLFGRKTKDDGEIYN